MKSRCNKQKRRGTRKGGMIRRESKSILGLVEQVGKSEAQDLFKKKVKTIEKENMNNKENNASNKKSSSSLKM